MTTEALQPSVHLRLSPAAGEALLQVAIVVTAR